MIDLAIAGTAPDGTLIYALPQQALACQVARGIVWLLVNHSRETLHALALLSVAGASIYFAHDVSKPEPKRSRRR
jgi:hypothetical protein